jgi:hypothetical protein
MTQEIQEIQIKILRLNTGEDIIGACLMDDEHGCVGVENPMKLHLRRVSMAGQAMLVMLPWLPLEVIEENYATINYDDIITVIDPKRNLIDHYTNTITEIEATMSMDKNDHLLEDEEEEEVDEDTMQEMLNSLRESKKNKLH